MFEGLKRSLMWTPSGEGSWPVGGQTVELVAYDYTEKSPCKITEEEKNLWRVDSVNKSVTNLEFST